MLVRHTRGGELRLAEPERGQMVTCGACGGVRPRDAEQPLMLGVQTTHPTTGQHLTLDTSICGDCLAEAFALLFGRRHVQRGGDATDFGQPIPPADPAPARTTPGFESGGVSYCCAAGARSWPEPCPHHGAQAVGDGELT